MKYNFKWAMALLPLFFVGCEDKVDVPTGPIAYEGDDVRFSVDNSPNSRTMYEDQWEEKNTQTIYWGNYVSADEYINIYSPDTERGFAKYLVSPQESNSNVAATVAKASEIGVQWGQSGKPYTFYAFYPADRASTTLENKNTIRASVDVGQSPQQYKWRLNTAEKTDLTLITGFDDYDKENFASNAVVGDPKTIYGMPNMNAAVMVAKTTMEADDFGKDVPLQFKVLADVLDLTINGPIKPNTLNTTGEAQFIKIQAVTIEVVNPGTGTTGLVEDYEIDTNTQISGSFDLNMEEGTVSNINGNSFVQLQLATNKDDVNYYPTLYVRGEDPGAANIDHLRLRAFLIPGQITGTTLGKLRVHLQTNCGDYYQMLQDDGNFATGKIYPVNFSYFKARGTEFELGAWVGQLNPDIYLSELSIPGAWHAANENYQGNVSLSDLYKAGIRAFEVHTKNGTTLYEPGKFTTEFNLNNIASYTEMFEEPFPTGEAATNTYGASNVDITSTGNWTQSITQFNGTWYSFQRPVTATATVTWTQTTTQYTVPKFMLRLYRTSDEISTGTPLSTAIINLAKEMNKDGLMFLEIGEEGQADVTAPYKSKDTVSKEYTLTTTITGYERSTSQTASGVYDWDFTSVDFSGVEPDTKTTTGTSTGTFSLNSHVAWSIAVRSCFERLADEVNPTTDKPVLYSGDLTANTTIRDVQGQVIAKVNTNAPEGTSSNEELYAWGTNCPALFSRWLDGSGREPLTINLAWKTPVAPYGPDGVADTPLRWCFTELEQIDKVVDGSAVGIEGRKKAIEAMNTEASKNYKEGLHRTFYETSLGGYVGSYGAAGCQSAAKDLNPFAFQRITNPTRAAVPLGIVFMNYAIPPTGEEATYQSADLIRAIVNNNKAFALNRADGTSGQAANVADNTNSHFTNNPQNPLK